MSVDLDAVIAAEVSGDPIDVTVGGKKYKLVPEMPWNVSILVGNGEAFAAFASLVVDEKKGSAFAAAMLTGKPGWPEVTRRMNAIYAVGESEASQRSSAANGRSSRPTSSTTTDSTPAAP